MPSLDENRLKFIKIKEQSGLPCAARLVNINIIFVLDSIKTKGILNLPYWSLILILYFLIINKSRFKLSAGLFKTNIFDFQFLKI